MNSGQEKVFEAIKLGRNTFITGGAGVGKSFIVHEIVKYFVENKINYSVTAMTGCAAVLVNGRTIHSFMGIGLAKGSAQDLFRKIQEWILFEKMDQNQKNENVEYTYKEKFIDYSKLK